MSYILEALRKAERERSLGQAPGLADVAQAPAAAVPPQRQRLPLVLGALTLLLASALLWSLLRRPAVSTPAAQPVAAHQQALTAATPPPAVAEPAVEDGESLATLDDLVPATAEPLSTLPQQASSLAMSPPAATAPTIIQPLAEPPRAAIELPPEAPAAETTQVETLQLDPSPIAGPKKLGEMPASYRAEFPQLVVDVHASNPDPRKRFVLINGRRYKETEALAEGPVIVEIPDGGILFDYRGERVMVPLSR